MVNKDTYYIFLFVLAFFGGRGTC